MDLPIKHHHEMGFINDEQLERLGNEDLTAEDLKTEVSRAKAITGIANNIINNAVNINNVYQCHFLQESFDLLQLLFL